MDKHFYGVVVGVETPFRTYVSANVGGDASQRRNSA